MITYDKGLWGNYVLFRMYGSAFPRAMPHACLSATIAAVLSALFHTTGWQLFSNSYPVQMFFFIVGFMVVFRCVLQHVPAALDGARRPEGVGMAFASSASGRMPRAIARTTLRRRPHAENCLCLRPCPSTFSSLLLFVLSRVMQVLRRCARKPMAKKNSFGA